VPILAGPSIVRLKETGHKSCIVKQEHMQQSEEKPYTRLTLKWKENCHDKVAAGPKHHAMEAYRRPNIF